jgi:anti-sigma B factor antagonist
MAFAIESHVDRNAAIMTLSGELDASAAPTFRSQIEALAGGDEIDRLVLRLDGLSYMASAGLRALVFAKQKLGAGVELILVGTQETVAETIELTGFHHSVSMVDSYDAEDSSER